MGKRVRVGWYDELRNVRDGLPEKALSRFRRAIEKLAEQYFERDEDGDLPVAWDIVDRTRYQRTYFEPIPHTHKAADAVAAEAEALRAAIGNVITATDQMNRSWKLLQHERSVAERKKAR